jgi:hypothetical protein
MVVSSLVPRLERVQISTYGLIRQAIVRRQQIVAIYKGLPRSFCPHAIGYTDGVARCLAYQFAGLSKHRVITPGSPQNWRCLLVDALVDVQVRDGPWYTAWNYVNPSTCIAVLDLSLAHTGS